MVALEAIQEMTERYVASMYEDSNWCALHAKRVTVFKRDMVLAMRLRGDCKWNWEE
jgi:histone H3